MLRPRDPPSPDPNRPRVLAVVPARDEGGRVGGVVGGARPFVDAVLVVNDGSRDRTAGEARRAGALVISHPRARGKGCALQTGYDYALREGYDIVVNLDGDGQHDPAEIPRLVDALVSDRGDLALGNRLAAPDVMPASRRFVNRISAVLASGLAGTTIADPHCGYRAVRARVLRSVRLRSRWFAGDPELALWAAFRSFRLVSVPVRSIYGTESSRIDPLVDGIRLAELVLRALGTRIGLGVFPRRTRRPSPEASVEVPLNSVPSGTLKT